MSASCLDEMVILSQRVRYALLLIAFLALLDAVWAGLLRIGWTLPDTSLITVVSLIN